MLTSPHITLSYNVVSGFFTLKTNIKFILYTEKQLKITTLPVTQHAKKFQPAIPVISHYKSAVYLQFKRREIFLKTTAQS